VAGELRGWHPDPFNAHERRYFSMDGKPTRLVSDGGRTTYDPPWPTPLSLVGPVASERSVLDQRQIPPHAPQSGAYQSVGADERRSERNSTTPARGGHGVERPSGRKPELLDVLFPKAPPARRAGMQRFVRYASASVISTLLGLSVLSVLIGAVGYPAVWSNVIAVAIATVPSFELNRRWVWADNGEHSILRQAVPYFVLSLVGLVISTFAVHVASNATHHSSRLVHTGAAEVANVASYGTFLLLEFLACDRILFRSSRRGPRSSERPASLKRPRPDEESAGADAASTE
jgi:putative flippase GtrA